MISFYRVRPAAPALSRVVGRKAGASSSHSMRFARDSARGYSPSGQQTLRAGKLAHSLAIY
jgi:hypothetical protein